MIGEHAAGLSSFETLKNSWKAEQATLKTDGKLEDEKAKAGAQARARKTAVTMAFEGVNFDEIQKSWEEYTLSLKAPKD